MASGLPRGGSPRPAASAACWAARFSRRQPFCPAHREPLEDALARCNDGRQVSLVEAVGEAVRLAHVVWGDGDDDVDVTSRLRDKFDAEARLHALECRATVERLVEALAAPQKANNLAEVNDRAVHADRRPIDAIGGDPEPVSVPVVCGVGKCATVNPYAKPRDLQVVLAEILKFALLHLHAAQRPDVEPRARREAPAGGRPQGSSDPTACWAASSSLQRRGAPLRLMA